MTRDPLHGVAAAPGVALAQPWRPPEAFAAGDGSRPAIPLDHAAARAATELEELADRLRRAGRADEAEIFGAQALMARTPSSSTGHVLWWRVEQHPTPRSSPPASRAQ